MTVLQGFRESKAFKLISDMSVIHWVYTIGPGFIASTVAAMRGRPLEDVLLYFFLISAAVLVLVHYSQVFYAKWKGSRRAIEQIEQKQNRNFGFVVPVMAFVAVLGVWIVANKLPKTVQPRMQAAVPSNNPNRGEQTPERAASKPTAKRAPSVKKQEKLSPVPTQQQSGKDNIQTGPITQGSGSIL